MKRYIEVAAHGEVNTIYTTETSKNPANPYDHLLGWMQVSTTTRRQVGSKRISGHEPMCIWEFCEVELEQEA